MQSNLSDLVDTLSEICKKDCKGCMEKQKIKSKCDFIGLINNKLCYKCKKCRKICFKSINGSIKDFPSLYQLCNGDINKFVFFVKKFSNKEAFNSKLNEEDITDKDYAHAQKVWEVFEIKNLCQYHDLYVQCDTLLLTDVFENFRNKYIEIYDLDLAHFLIAPGLAWHACLKKTEAKLELLTDIDMLLMFERELDVEFVKQYIGMLKQTIKM